MKLYRHDFIVLGSVMIILFLQLVNVYVQNQLSTVGFLYGDVFDQIQQYKLENDTLRTKVKEARSLRIIQAEAGKMGFHTITKNDYLILW